MKRRPLPLHWLALGGGATARSSPTPAPAPGPALGDHGDDGHHGHHAGHTMPHGFERADEWVARFDDGARDGWQKPAQVLASLNLQPTDVVADIGAGTGYFTVRLAKLVHAGKVYASDIEPDMVRYLSERARQDGLDNVVAVRGTATDPNLPERVRVALVVDALHHVRDRVALLHAMANDLADGGYIVIVDFKPDAPDDAPAPPREHRLAATELVRDAEAAGLRSDGIDENTLPYQYVLRLTR